MKITSKDIFEKLIAPMGIKMGQKFNVRGLPMNPYHINEDYIMVDSNGYTYTSLNPLIEQEITHIPSPTKEEVYEELKELAGGWKPDWKNKKQYKYLIYHIEGTDFFDWGTVVRYRYLNQIYFKSREDVVKAMATLGEKKLKILFEVE